MATTKKKAMKAGPKYPDILYSLPDGENANLIIAQVRRALMRNGVGVDEVKAFTDEAMSGDYANVFATCKRWVTCL